MFYGAMNVNTYPTLRFYMGTITLYIEYKGSIYDEEKQAIHKDVDTFIDTILGQPFQLVEEDTENPEEYANFLIKENPSFLMFTGPKDTDCYRLFHIISQSSNKYEKALWEPE